ncbi:hypothetical protein CEXT_162221 [Caerostris extrusa]|uniref:Ribosomal protein L5 n=1 Tax=Caerostris extrusa TaxID=172846 RepID=A0AAV4XC43_CAEEX|nr:hypothetical protein CEXT_162221 [Caerostris extrusa]
MSAIYGQRISKEFAHSVYPWNIRVNFKQYIPQSKSNSFRLSVNAASRNRWVAKPPSTNLYSTSDINLIHTLPSPALELKFETFGDGWVGKQFTPAHPLLRFSGLLDSFRPENAGRTPFNRRHRNPAIYGQRISKEFAHSI